MIGLQLVVLNSEGRDYFLEVFAEKTVKWVTKMAVCDLFGQWKQLGV